jgi:hypothetical protein
MAIARFALLVHLPRAFAMNPPVKFYEIESCSEPSRPQPAWHCRRPLLAGYRSGTSSLHNCHFFKSHLNNMRHWNRRIAVKISRLLVNE